MRWPWLLLVLVACGPEPAPEAPVATIDVEPTPDEPAPTAPPPTRKPPGVLVCDRELIEGPGVIDEGRSRSKESAQLYADALAARDADQIDKARKLLLTLVERRSDPFLIPYAYFIFGEMFRAEADDDPSKAELALRFYQEALKYTFRAKPLALLRSGEMKERTGDPTRALEAYADAGRVLQSWSDGCREDLTARAAAGFDRVYPIVGRTGLRCTMRRRVFPDLPCD